LAQLDVGILPGQIAILTPYQAQVTLLNSLLRPKHGQALEIGTVDGMQGREKEAVIISLVRSNDTVCLSTFGCDVPNSDVSLRGKSVSSKISGE
jgi:superfamily I DNA and/or RNA helicase